MMSEKAKVKSERAIVKTEKSKVKRRSVFSLFPFHFCLLLFSLFLISTAQAQQNGLETQFQRPQELEILETYFRMAVEQNPELASLKAQIDAQEERVPQVSGLPDPQVSVSYFINPPNEADVAGRFSVSAMQMFPWFGTLNARGNVQESIGEAMGHSLDKRQLQIFAEIQDLWFTYYKLNHHVHVNHEILQLIHDLERQVETRYETGETGQADLLRLEMEEQRLLNRIEALEDEKNPVRERLNALLNRDSEEAVIVPNLLPERDLPWSKEELFEFAQTLHPEFKELEARERQYQQEVEVARLEGRPSFGLGLEYMGGDYGYMNAMPDMNKSFIGMATIRIPLYRGKYKAQTQEARSQLQANDAMQTELSNRFRADLEQAMKDFRDTEREYRLITEELLPRSEQVLDILLDEYTTGRTAFDELIQTFRELLSLENERVEVLSTQNEVMANIEQLIAIELNNHN